MIKIEDLPDDYFGLALFQVRGDLDVSIGVNNRESRYEEDNNDLHAGELPNGLLRSR